MSNVDLYRRVGMLPYDYRRQIAVLSIGIKFINDELRQLEDEYATRGSTFPRFRIGLPYTNKKGIVLGILMNVLWNKLVKDIWSRDTGSLCRRLLHKFHYEKFAEEELINKKPIPKSCSWKVATEMSQLTKII